MIRLAEEFFDVRNDPDQLSVTPEVIEYLRRIHPRSLSEEADADGPIAWILLIPTTARVMNEFLEGVITEAELLSRTHPGERFQAIYLCSALVLPEHRNKGLAKRLTLEAIEEIRAGYPVEALYYWPFSREGDRLARGVGKACGLPVKKRMSARFG